MLAAVPLDHTEMIGLCAHIAALWHATLVFCFEKRERAVSIEAALLILLRKIAGECYDSASEISARLLFARM